MLISVIGCGYLGAVHAAAMAELGHHVIGVDVDAPKITSLAAGRAPFFEPGLPQLLDRNVSAGRLEFTTDFERIRGCQVHFIGVGTPQRDDTGAADLQYVDSAIDAMLPHLGHFTGGTELVVGKSTVPVGTAARLAEIVAPTGVTLVWNPEFLREGFAVQDTLQPDRMVYGLPTDELLALRAERVLDEVYEVILDQGVPRLTMDFATAELVKVSANSFLATKISFINAMAQVCDAAGADVVALAKAIGMDERIGRRFLRAGIGFGGGCLPKDIRAFRARAAELGVGDALAFLGEVDRVNEVVRHSVLDMVEDAMGLDLTGRRICMLGAAFKPDSDDMRNSPALDLARSLNARGAEVRVHDPEAGTVLRARGESELLVAETIEEALRDADMVILGTEWKVYTDLDPVAVGRLVASRRVIDGRNVLQPRAWKAAGWEYRGIGRR